MPNKPGAVITGTEDNDTLYGTRNNDMIRGLAGADTMYGDHGNDTYFVDNSGDLVFERNGRGIDEVLSSVSIGLRGNIENLTLVDGAVNGFGNVLDNVITGNELGNVLRGARGNDVIVGNDGNDQLDGGTGDDYLEGGTGNDLYIVDSAGDVVVEQADGGTDRVHSSIDYELAGTIEALKLVGTSAINGRGNELNNTINGNAAGNVLEGFSGNDKIGGLGGNDSIVGGDGHDNLFGGAGNDTLDGGADNDRLNGGAGNDVLTGGDGADRFGFNTALDETTNVDTITDFSEQDTIVVVQSLFAGLDAGNLDPSAFHEGSAAADADDRIIYDSTTGALYHDADGNGDGAQQLFAYVTAGTQMTAADFFVFG